MITKFVACCVVGIAFLTVLVLGEGAYNALRWLKDRARWVRWFSL